MTGVTGSQEVYQIEIDLEDVGRVEDHISENDYYECTKIESRSGKDAILVEDKRKSQVYCVKPAYEGLDLDEGSVTFSYFTMDENLDQCVREIEEAHRNAVQETSNQVSGDYTMSALADRVGTHPMIQQTGSNQEVESEGF